MKIKLLITGIVQGIGFRPFVYNLALSLGINGYVTNTSKGVEIIASGDKKSLTLFKDHIRNTPPLHAVIDTFSESSFTGNERFRKFTIKTSKTEKIKFTRVSPDLMVCNECMEEVLDSRNRRYYYPYINCTHCGPRYTIIGDVPYDRPFTTMAGFRMCEKCRSEYEDPTDRRFHAQPNACHSCGPHLSLIDHHGSRILAPETGEEYVSFFSTVSELLKQGNIIACKGIGGFHLMCDACNESPVGSLRIRKYREDKPFALMAQNPGQAALYAYINENEEKRLLKVDRPILLLSKKSNTKNVTPLAPSVAPYTKLVGIMLPYTPFHYLLFEHFHGPLVMTSANISDEPIVYSNKDAIKRLWGIADYFITGSRGILIRCDDSVTRIRNNSEYYIRRSRGIVPTPVFLSHRFKRNVLALGPFQKNTICLGKQDQAILSHHIGDLDDMRTMESFTQAIRHLMHISDCRPELIAHDLHPQYLSTRFAFDPPKEFLFIKNIKKAGVQHHHAHLVSCMADNNISGKVMGIILDGTGFGPDNTVWGGEILLADEKSYSRPGCLKPIPLPGSEAAIKKPWRMALSYVYQLYGEEWQSRIPACWGDINKQEMQMTVYQIKQAINAPLSSSCGRLFDSIAALCGLRKTARYEGQPAIELEQQIDPSCASSYKFDCITDNEPYLISWENVIDQVLKEVRLKKDITQIAAKFHNGLINVLIEMCRVLAQRTGIWRVVLSGGCFMNMYLLKGLSEGLVSSGFNVYTHQRVPCNDGGISLGQAIIADSGIEGEN